MTHLATSGTAVPSVRTSLLERAVWVTAEGVALVEGGKILWANPALHALCGADPEVLTGRPVSSLVVRALDAECNPVKSVLECADPQRCGRLLLERLDGSTIAVGVTVDRLDGVPGGACAVRMREITAEIRIDEALRSSEARFRALAERAPIGVFHSDVGVRLAYANDRFAEVWGRPVAGVLGDRWIEAVVQDDRPDLLTAAGTVLGGGEASCTLRIERPDGGTRTVEVRLVAVAGSDRQASFVGSVEDITDLRAREAALAWQANHDALTALPNRAALRERVHQHVVSAPRPVALLFFDLDDFKNINDTLGHQTGDSLLREVADRLLDAVRVDDVVARFGGDEFVVFCPTIDSESEAVHVGERVLASLALPFEIDGRRLEITASAGVLFSPDGERDVDALIRDADVAMYQAKGGGKGRTAVFDAAVQQHLEKRVELARDLRVALEAGNVEVHYQPIVRPADRRLVGAEALLRYHHPELGPMPANEVVGAAEQSGCIGQLGAHVLRRACRDLARWRHEHGDRAPDYVTVNVSALQLADRGFVSLVRDTLADARLASTSLCLELTESQLMTDVHRAEEVLGRLSDLGVRLAIDDFGTGYSSLAYLRRFPVSVVKIDGSFVSDPGDAYAAAIIEAVVSVTAAIGADVVAEGVETVDQLRAVSRLGCSLIQGYLLSKPVPATALIDAVAAHRLDVPGTAPRRRTR